MEISESEGKIYSKHHYDFRSIGDRRNASLVNFSAKKNY